ncbi:hypothetical protein SmJEL517_g02757 [Synchytrium microbalum]|uniref:GIT Spa2 homology (SHD) domain-containing protein n=1 Tax=Synchytrium microbalum TaxID=1806994 RepID=A0A507C9U0_9FUNG|nr:uncharacterized protein SmJEL517_g02757 [Synchytrium microbalum]TPX34756.1 hypothetical protein SmJEL517_g02757 [Synchytrium microbalum]
MADYDHTTLQHYESLKVYLASYLQNQKSSTTASNQRASAREKLTRLTQQQFQELSTDVYDEMTRRQDSADTIPFLPVKDEFHPKRNQARQKLATLPNSRFKDLASDVYYELERRFPGLIADPNSGKSPAEVSPASSESATDPSRETMSPVQPAEVSFASLDNLMADLGNMLNSTSAAPPPNINGTARESTVSKSIADDGEVSRLKARIAQLETIQDSTTRYDTSGSRIKELEDRLAGVMAESREKDEMISKLSEDAQKAKENYESLQEDYNQQQQIANDIRAEATNLLDEIKSLSRKNDELNATHERDQATIKQLREENERLQKHPSSAGGSSNVAAVTKSVADPTLRESPSFDYIKESLMYVDNGVINRQRIVTYQSAVEDLMKASRSDQPTSVLVAMKSIVMSCKGITEDTEHYEQSETTKPAEFTTRLSQVKTRLSAALTGLMTAAKTHAQSYGSAPHSISEVEGAATNLTSVILDLVRTLKSRDDESLGRSVGGSTSTTVNGVNGGVVGGASHSNGTETYEVDELKGYLEKQTDMIVQAIQSLLFAMRQNTPVGHEFKDTVGNITKIVDNLIKVSRRTLSSPSALSKPTFASSGDRLLQQLSSANLQFGNLGDSMVNSPQSKTLKQQVAASSYEIAKCGLGGWLLKLPDTKE